MQKYIKCTKYNRQNVYGVQYGYGLHTQIMSLLALRLL